jgi:putative FmdB family regulatory protein
MPVYVYHCGDCDYEFEQQQKFTDKPLKVCPECKKVTLHKVYTPVGVIYKGSGFYSTDHRSGSSASSYKKGRKEEKGESDKEGKKEEPKLEKKETAKPEKKAETEKAKPVTTTSGE